jgi:spore maturation protein CgeB
LRILIVDTCYPAFLKMHYGRAPNLGEQPYSTQWRALMDTFFGTADAYSHNLNAIGHEAHEVVVNCVPMQSAWAREHDLAVPPDRAESSVLLAQARDFEPDVVYVQNVHYLSETTLDELKRLGRLLVGQIATEPPGLEQLRAFDLLVTCLPSFVARFNGAGIRTELMRLAFDERVLEELSGEERPRVERGAVFVGSLGRTQHRRSNGMLARAARRVPIEFWGYGGRLWPPWSPVKRGYHGEAWGIDMFRILGEARIALNRHGSIAGPYAVNMRLYEATGMGTLLVTDNGEHLDDVLVPGEEAVTYSTTRELVDRVRYFLAHENERAEIAAAGQARTLRDHTYGRRMHELAAMLEDVAA